MNTPDVDGRSLLDNTILLHCSELGLGHRTDRVPFMFIGGKNLGFQLGQAINFSGTVPAFGMDPHRDPSTRSGSASSEAPETSRPSGRSC